MIGFIKLILHYYLLTLLFLKWFLYQVCCMFESPICSLLCLVWTKKLEENCCFFFFCSHSSPSRTPHCLFGSKSVNKLMKRTKMPQHKSHKNIKISHWTSKTALQFAQNLLLKFLLIKFQQKTTRCDQSIIIPCINIQ